MIFKSILNRFKSILLVPLPLPMRFIHKTTMTPTTTKLSELRKLMEERQLTAYYIPSEDAHQVKIIMYMRKFLLVLFVE